MIILLGGCPSGQRSLSLPEARLCGQAYEALGQLDMAIDNFREALEITPGLESAEEGFAWITEQQKHSDRGK